MTDLKKAWRGLRRRMVPRSLFGRSLMIILIPLLLLQMIVAFFFFDRHWETMTAKLVSALTGEIVYIADSLEADPASSPQIARRARAFELEVTVVKGVLSPATLRATQELRWLGIDRRMKAALTKRLDRPFVFSGHDGTGRDKAFEVRVQLKDGRIAHILCPDRRLSSATTHIFPLWMMGGAALLSLIAAAFMRNQVRPIRRLALAAEKFGKGEDVPAFRPEGAAEVRQAAAAFLEMSARLKRQMEQRAAMLAGVSHDLRTPLTRMRLQLAMTPPGPGRDDLVADVAEMERMVEGYLTFAKGGGGEKTETADVSPILQRVAAGARRQGFEVDVALPGSMPLRMRPVALERALANVVSNACKYGGRVWVSAEERQGSFNIFVDDNGPGIPEAQRDEVFRPFHRLEPSRNSKTGGIGLGLAIAKDAVHGHGGEISLSTSPHGGLRVCIRLPH